MVVAASFIAVAARMSLVQFLGIYFVHRAGIDVTTVGLAFLCENLARGMAAPLFGALSDRLGRRALLIASSLVTALVLPAFLLVHDALALLVWSLLLGQKGKPLLYSEGQYAKLASLTVGEPLPEGLDYWGF